MGLTSASALVTRVAVHAVIHISIHVRVFEVGCVVAAMAAGAGKDRVVGRIGVAGCAHAVRVPVGGWEERVVRSRQSRRGPVRSRVARGAGGRPLRRGVVGIGRAGIVGRVARIAIGRRAREDIIDVAQVACDSRVGTRQREWRVGVVECGAGPVRRRMARVASRGESSRGMGRIGRPVPIGLVAAVAKGRQGAVVGGRAGMAQHALHGGVEAGQRERGGRVIERRRSPVGGRVADGAIGREAGGDVRRVGGSGEVRLMAGIAGCGQVVVVVVGVALRACHGRVSTGQGPVGIQRVVEGNPRGPRCWSRAVAGVARCGERRSHVTGVIGAREVGLVAAVAGSRHGCVVVVGVACGAGQRGMCADQREHRRVIKGG